MKKEFIQSIKIITLSLVIGLGVSVVYATDWTAPLSSAPTCTSGNPGCDVPINVGSTGQSKAGGLAIGTTGAPGTNQLYVAAGGAHFGLSTFTRVTNAYPALEVGDVAGNYPEILIHRFAQSANNMGTWGVNNSTGVTYPAPVCADTDGTLILCPAPSGTVDLTLSETSYNQQYTNTTAPSASRSATLTWTVPAGASCVVGNQTETPAGTVTGWPVGYTINSSGSASVTFTRYGASTLTLTCDYGGGTPSDTVTYTYNGTDTFTSNGSFTVPTAVTTMTFKAVGGGGGGADAGDHAGCNPDPFCVATGIDGGNTIIDGPGTTLDFTANKGTHGFECVDGFETCAYHGYVPSFVNGTPGNGSSTNSPTVYEGAGSTSGSPSVGLSSYGNGGSGTGVRYGGGSAAISANNKTVTPGNSFSVTIGQGGAGGVDQSGVEADGVDGVVQFSW